MEYRNFEKLGISPSLLGFGCMRFPLNEDGSICEPEAEKMLDTAIAAGVTYIDTAYPYHDSLKDVMHKFLVLRENSLVLVQSKSF